MTDKLLKNIKYYLTNKHMKIAVAESLTCGQIQAALGSISGSSDFFEGGITAYSLQQKVRLLNIDRQYAESVNCVSQEIAFNMAAAACSMFESDIGLAATGYAEACPQFGIDQPMAYIAICRLSGGKIERIAGKLVNGGGLSRIAMQKNVSTNVLEMLCFYLENGGFD
jgi:nicotinamide-nucleotide amidase